MSSRIVKCPSFERVHTLDQGTIVDSEVLALSQVDKKVLDHLVARGGDPKAPIVSTWMEVAGDGLIKAARLHVSRQKGHIRVNPIRIFPVMKEESRLTLDLKYGRFQFAPGNTHSEWVNMVEFEPRLLITNKGERDTKLGNAQWAGEGLKDFCIRLHVVLCKGIEEVCLHVVALPGKKEELSTMYKGDYNKASYPVIELTKNEGFHGNARTLPVRKDGLPIYPFLTWPVLGQEEERVPLEYEKLLEAMYAIWSAPAAPAATREHGLWRGRAHPEGGKEPSTRALAPSYTWPSLAPLYIEEDSEESASSRE